ncbi:MAG: hypothetical protein KatS3mg009_2399 [Acidimicrobiia bacterium]|nr:MAG: hypothetical protein KatS3mg009_2399 [Acidimicrobiia bacterium]
MSGLWTPPGSVPGDGGDRTAGPAGAPGAAGPGDPGAPASPEELAALRELHARLVATPVADVVANHALGIWQLALVHLGVVTPPDEQGRRPAPDLPAAGLAIDALAALVDGLGPRLGEHEATLRDALAQAQRLFVEVADAAGG